MKTDSTENLKNNDLRYAEYYGMTATLDELYEKSKNSKKFRSLMPLICSTENILLAYRSIKRNSGSMTPGKDKLTIKNIESLNQQTFIEIVRKRFNHYRPRMVKRVEIPKPNGKLRPLGIPSIWDRITQQCIKQILEPICEAKFNRHSYGFRPNCSTEHAIADCAQRINISHMNYVVDVDIKGFFDEVNHSKLIRQLWSLGIQDKQLLVIIRRMLKAPIMLTDGQILYPKKGTPQGGILSPLLANINLNEFDWWATNQWENRCCEEIKRVYNQNGSENKGHHYRKLRSSTKLKEFYLVRYADDFKLFCVNQRTAWKVFYATRKWLATRLKLPISEEKSKVTNLKKQDSEFLGFTIKKMQSKNRNIMRSHISPKALKAIEYQLKEQIKKIQRNPNSQKTIEEIRRYNSKVIGIHQYYRIATCVSIDLKKVHYRCLLLMKNRLSGNGLTKNGKYMGTDKGIIPYARSPMMRYLQRQPLLPIGLIKTKNALFKKRSICKYTEAGRKEMHSKQSSVSKFKLGILRNLPIKGVRGTTELNDNRISLFIAQKGLCGIMGQELEIHDMHCHHKIPYHLTKDDSYSNLILLGSLPHRLIHVIKEETIRKYMNVVNPNSEQLEKLNKLREMAGNEKIFLN